VKHTTVLLSVLALVGTAPAIDSLNVRLIGFYHTANAAHGVAVDSGYACITDINGSLRIISVADPAHLSEVGHYDTTCGRWSAAIISGSYVYLPDTGSGVHVISIADPAHPVEVGFLNTPSGIGGIVVSGQYAYMAGGTELLVVSVADPANPAIVATCDTSGTAVSNVAVNGDYAYVIDYNQGLEVISVADPLHPVEVGHCDLTGASCVAVSGSYVCAAGQFGLGLSVISVADPANPVKVGSCDMPPGSVNDLDMDGDMAYVGVGACGLWAVSIADPAHPLEVGHYRENGQANGVTLDDGYIFVADGSTGLLILQYYQSGVEESFGPQAPSRRLLPTVSRSLPPGAVVFDAMGRRVLDPKPGVYFVRDEGRGAGDVGRVRKVVVQR
jgi:hypothetical protein